MEKIVYQNPQLEVADYGKFIAGDSITEGNNPNAGTGGGFDNP